MEELEKMLQLNQRKNERTIHFYGVKKYRNELKIVKELLWSSVCEMVEGQLNLHRICFLIFKVKNKFSVLSLNL